MVIFWIGLATAPAPATPPTPAVAPVPTASALVPTKACPMRAWSSLAEMVAVSENQGNEEGDADFDPNDEPDLRTLAALNLGKHGKLSVEVREEDGGIMAFSNYYLVLRQKKMLYGYRIGSSARTRVHYSTLRVRSLRKIGDRVWLELEQQSQSGSEGSGPETETVTWDASLFDLHQGRLRCLALAVPLRIEKTSFADEPEKTTALHQIDADVREAELVITERTEVVTEDQSRWVGTHALPKAD